MLFLSFTIWIVVVFALRVSLWGNPSYLLLKRTPTAVMHRAAEYVEEEDMPEDEDVQYFLGQFYRLTLLTFALFLAEMGVAIYFTITKPKMFVPWFIITKNLLMLVAARSFHRGSDGDSTRDVFQRVLDMPMWMVRGERIGYLLTAVGFLFLFLVVNQLVTVG